MSITAGTVSTAAFLAPFLPRARPNVFAAACSLIAAPTSASTLSMSFFGSMSASVSSGAFCRPNECGMYLRRACDATPRKKGGGKRR